MDYYKRRCKKERIEVLINYCDYLSFDYIKMGEDISVFIADVKVDGLLSESYFIEVENLSANRFNAVVKRFLEDPDFRKSLDQSVFDIKGEVLSKWTIPYNKDREVNERCLSLIRKINSKDVSKAKFKDYAGLKTFGRDGFSLMKEDDLKTLISQHDIVLIKNTFPEDKNALHCTRRVARGLKVNHAIRKVKTDIEITNNNRH